LVANRMNVSMADFNSFSSICHHISQTYQHSWCLFRVKVLNFYSWLHHSPKRILKTKMLLHFSVRYL
jgi:hypothetical protein